MHHDIDTYSMPVHFGSHGVALLAEHTACLNNGLSSQISDNKICAQLQTNARNHMYDDMPLHSMLHFICYVWIASEQIRVEHLYLIVHTPRYIYIWGERERV